MISQDTFAKGGYFIGQIISHYIKTFRGIRFIRLGQQKLARKGKSTTQTNTDDQE
jgi:hypothetical protein